MEGGEGGRGQIYKYTNLRQAEEKKELGHLEASLSFPVEEVETTVAWSASAVMRLLENKLMNH